MLPVNGSVKNYHWGKIGNDSYIARFQEVALSRQPPTKDSTTQTVKTNEENHDTNKPLAELWFGSHPSGPAIVAFDNQHVKLDAFLNKQPEMVGSVEHYKKFNKQLPFLFKILSVAQPLSLQAHPDKKLAQILHKKDPNNYPDPNHKPELAIALTDFEVLCDFRPPKEILHYMSVLEPFRRVVGEKNFEHYSKTHHNGTQEQQRAALAQCFKSLMLSDKDLISAEAKNLLLTSSSTKSVDKDLLKVIDGINKLYPGDPGIFAPFFLNYFKLTAGQAVFLRANKLHAYLKGECIECMACSDNVVRAGLTTKYRDVDTLINMLDYETVKDPHDILLAGVQHSENPAVISFAPAEEFKVDKITINEKIAPTGEYSLSSLSSGSFIVVLSGKASTRNFFNLNVEHKLALGSAGFIPPKIALKLYNIQGTLTIYRSYC